MPDALKEKALKITEALYLTTDLFSEGEPMKWSLRANALEIMKVAPEDVLRLEKLVNGMLLELELAASGTFISKMNFEVLKKAYAEYSRESATLSDTYKILSDPPIAIAMRQASKPGSDMSLMDRPLTDRREALVLALKQKGPLGVGDLEKMLDAPISEKTVQRELGTLVASGAIKQEGEKRWRRYFI